MTPKNPKTIEIDLDSGVCVWVTPLNRYHIDALVEKANELFPLPDKKAFESVIEEGAIAGGVVIPAEDNPAYIELFNEINQKQHNYKLAAMIDICVHFPHLGSQADVIAHFADFIAAQRRHMDLPDDDWQATWRYAVLRTDQDEAVVIQAMKNQLPLTEAEVSEEMTLFRRLLPKSSTNGLPKRESEARRTET